jgi:hypothetical protein
MRIVRWKAPAVDVFRMIAEFEVTAHERAKAKQAMRNRFRVAYFAAVAGTQAIIVALALLALAWIWEEGVGFLWLAVICIPLYNLYPFCAFEPRNTRPIPKAILLGACCGFVNLLFLAATIGAIWLAVLFFYHDEHFVIWLIAVLVLLWFVPPVLTVTVMQSVMHERFVPTAGGDKGEQTSQDEPRDGDRGSERSIGEDMQQAFGVAAPFTDDRGRRVSVYPSSRGSKGNLRQVIYVLFGAYVIAMILLAAIVREGFLLFACALAGTAIAVSAFRSWRRRGAGIVRECIARQLCPSCHYGLEGLSAEEGFVQCPECAAVWRADRFTTSESN